MSAQLRLVVCMAAFAPDRTCLVAQRAPGSRLGGFWELPGGKFEATDADPALAVARELEEELGIRWPQFDAAPRLVDLIRFEKMGDDDFVWLLGLYTVRLANTIVTPDGKSHSDWRWIKEEQIKDLGFTPSTSCLLNRNRFLFLS